MKKREKVTAFDFENAFKAISELDNSKKSHFISPIIDWDSISFL